MTRRPIPFLFVAAAASLSACKEDAELRVSQDEAGVQFEIVAKGAFEPCINWIGVHRAGDAASLWAIVKTADGSCSRKIALGDAPKGYRVETPASRWRKDVQYVVEVGGNGFTEQQTFTIR